MNQACDLCGPAVRAAYRVNRKGELYSVGTAPPSCGRPVRARLGHLAHRSASAHPASRLATLRRVVAIGTGFGAAAMYASEAQQHPMVAPGIAYYLITACGILAALGIIAATFPLLARITGPETARNE